MFLFGRCGWGTAAQNAAIKASTAFVDYLSLHLKKAVTAAAAGDLLLLALNAAGNKILDGDYSSKMNGLFFLPWFYSIYVSF